MRNLRYLILIVGIFFISSCSWLAKSTAPTKVASKPSQEAMHQADLFWQAFHNGDYQKIDALTESHLQVLVKDPNDALTISHIAFLYSWKFSERNRLPESARSIENATLAKRYFEEAVTLNPDEARFKGFAAGFTMAEASILKNEKQLRQGYYEMKDAISMWPEFNLFTSGYVMSRNESGSKPFNEGLEQQWENLDVCFGEKVSRHSPEIQKYLSLETQVGPKRACWNSWIAPHNWEGFFLNFGDMLVRANDLTNARVMYEATKFSKDYQQWPYRDVLERRLNHLNELPKWFAQAKRDEPEATSMINSRFSCVACHQKASN